MEIHPKETREDVFLPIRTPEEPRQLKLPMKPSLGD
jgi:hypothetical protein